MKKALDILEGIREGNVLFDRYESMTDEEIELYFDEAIKELKEAMKPKYCTSCIHASIGINVVICGRQGTYCEDKFYCNRYEPKDTQCGL